MVAAVQPRMFLKIFQFWNPIHVHVFTRSVVYPIGGILLHSFIVTHISIKEIFITRIKKENTYVSRLPDARVLSGTASTLHYRSDCLCLLVHFTSSRSLRSLPPRKYSLRSSEYHTWYSSFTPFGRTLHTSSVHPLGENLAVRSSYTGLQSSVLLVAIAPSRPTAFPPFDISEEWLLRSSSCRTLQPPAPPPRWVDPWSNHLAGPRQQST